MNVVDYRFAVMADIRRKQALAIAVMAYLSNEDDSSQKKKIPRQHERFSAHGDCMPAMSQWSVDLRRWVKEDPRVAVAHPIATISPHSLCSSNFSETNSSTYQPQTLQSTQSDHENPQTHK